MKKSLVILFTVVAMISCKKDDTPATPAATNTLTFGTVYENVVMTGAVYGSKWQLNAVIDLPSVGGFARKLAFNLNFLQKPAANTSYTIVTTDADITATSANLYINHVDYNPSPSDNISQSYFLKSGTTGAITVSIVSGKVSILFNGLTLTGNRSGDEKTSVSATLTEN